MTPNVIGACVIIPLIWGWAGIVYLTRKDK